MKNTHLIAVLIGLVANLVGCDATTFEPCTAERRDKLTGQTASDKTLPAPFTESSDPYSIGPLSTIVIDLPSCQDAAPVPMRIHAPLQPGAYPVIIFQHGLLTSITAYDQLLEAVASHGFIIVAAQMYAAGDTRVLTNNPTLDEETGRAKRVLDWLPTHLSKVAGVDARTDLIGITGHSRGGDIGWRLLHQRPEHMRAFMGIDAVADFQSQIEPAAVANHPPVIVPVVSLGFGAGSACAPTNSNHNFLYAAASSPAWHVFAPDAGHVDILDDPGATQAERVCGTSGDRAAVRQLVSGLMVSLFRAALQVGDSADADIQRASSLGIRTTIESK